MRRPENAQLEDVPGWEKKRECDGSGIVTAGYLVIDCVVRRMYGSHKSLVPSAGLARSQRVESKVLAKSPRGESLRGLFVVQGTIKEFSVLSGKGRNV
jgi:hypothetical protein